MKRIVLWLILGALVMIAILAYQARSRNHFNVTPDAEREIEKAMRH
jgi:hypothetical protein